VFVRVTVMLKITPIDFVCWQLNRNLAVKYGGGCQCSLKGRHFACTVVVVKLSVEVEVVCAKCVLRLASSTCIHTDGSSSLCLVGYRMQARRGVC